MANPSRADVRLLRLAKTVKNLSVLRAAPLNTLAYSEADPNLTSLVNLRSFLSIKLINEHDLLHVEH
jgi:hypothetical protein